MIETGCTREPELAEAIQAGRWPDACDPALRAHVDACGSCAGLAAIVAPLRDEHRALLAEAAVPSAAIVWWRAQRRFRQDAAARAAQPVTVVQGIVLACAAGLLATVLGIFVPTFRRGLGWAFGAATDWSNFALPQVIADPFASPLVAVGIAVAGACLVALPVALYLALYDD